MWPALIAAIASSVAGYGLNKLFGGGGGGNQKMPAQPGTFATNQLQVPGTLPVQPAPLQFGQKNPYQTANLDAATERALARYAGR